MCMQTHLAWDTSEYVYQQRSTDWFWGLGILAVGGVVLSIIFGNLLFGLVIAIGVVALSLHALRHPRPLHCEITERGVLIGTTLFPYATLQSFWIHEDTDPQQLVLTSRKMAVPYITVQLETVTAEEVREILKRFLREVEVHRTFFDLTLNRFGF